MDKFLIKKRSAEDSVQPPPTKKSKPATKFNSSHSQEFSFMKSSQKGDTYAFCTICVCDISIASGGRDAIKRHVGGLKHLDAVKLKDSSSVQKVTGFFAKDDDLSVIRAEVLWTQFVIEKNLPLSVSDDFGSLLKQMCKDSEIAKKFSCARTKTRAIAGCLSNAVRQELVAKMKSFPFSIGTDGSSDIKSKLYPIVVTSNDEVSQEICTDLLSIPELNDASTGANITALLLEELKRHNIPIKNCVGFMSDNAAVMTGKENGVSTILKKGGDGNPNMISLGCGCHLLNLAVKKGLSALPVDIDEILTDVYYFFHHSDKKNLEFDRVQLLYNDETKKLLKHCPTRWLSISTTLQRMVELWQPLSTFMQKVKEEEVAAAKKKEMSRKKKKKSPKQLSEEIINSMFQSSPSASASSSTAQDTQPSNPKTSSRLDRLLEVLKSKRCLIYCSFVLWIMPVFDKFNKCLQKEEPQIQKLNDLYLSLYREVLSKFIKPTVIRSHEYNITAIDFEDESNHLGDLYVGKLAMGLLSGLNAKNKSDVISSIKQLYYASLHYMRNSFPINSEVLCNAQFLNILKREKCTFSNALFFLLKMPVLNCTVDQLQEEFVKYQTSSHPAPVMAESRCDKQWNLLLQHTSEVDGSRPYYHLARLALSVLSIPHGNATAERIFSLVRKNRSEGRSLMSTETLDVLLVNKTRNTQTNPLQLTDQLLKKCKRATMESLQQPKLQ